MDITENVEQVSFINVEATGGIGSGLSNIHVVREARLLITTGTQEPVCMSGPTVE